MKKQTSTKTTTKKQIASELAEFFERYAAILYAARDFIARVAKVAERSGEDPWVTTQQVAEHISEQLPATYLKTFGADEPKRLKVWRILNMLSTASYLGAYESIGIRSRRGKGLTVEGSRRRLRVIAGGKS